MKLQLNLRIFFALAVILALFLIVVPAAKADGVIIIDDTTIPPYPPVPPLPTPWPPKLPVPTPLPIIYLPVKYHRVTVTIEDQVATTKIDQVFLNEYDRDLEGTYIFPLPEEATISRFVMWADGQPLEGRVLNRDEARRIYEDIVGRRRDPALLEYVGRNAFRAQVFPIPAHGEKRIQIEYSQVLPLDQGLVRYVYPLNTEKFSPKPLQQVSVDVQIRSREPIKAIYSPSHAGEIVITRPKNDDYQAEVSYEASNVRPDKDFELVYTLAPGDFGLNLLTYRERGEDGFFLLLAAPKVEFEAGRVVPKDVICVLDTSGSMSGRKIEQAKQALRFVLDNLNDADRFNIVAFSTTVNRYADGLQPARQRDQARRFVDDLQASGSTNINQALLEALKGLDPARPTVLIFLTDGLPTVGVTNPEQIIANVGQAAPKSVRLFAFGVGDDVNTVLLDTLAQQQRGATEYVRPGEDIEDKVSAFYAKVSQPVLADLQLDFGRIRVYDTYPDTLPDLFVGSQLVLAGRYKGDGSTTVTLRGLAGNREQRFTYNVTFPAENTANAYIPRLWATRKIGYLLTQIRLHGQNQEIIDEIVQLSTRYGIITPYTSFLVDERSPSPLSLQGQQAAGKELAQQFAAPAPASGPQAVQDSQTLQALRQGAPVPTVAPAPGVVVPAESSVAAAPLKQVADKTFLLRNGVWMDTTYKEGAPTTKLAFGSEDYFQLLAARPEWGKYFAVGERVIVVLDSQAYEVAEGSFPPVSISPTAVPTVTPQPPQPTPRPPTPTHSPVPPTIAPTYTPTPTPMPTPTTAPSVNLLAQIWAWLLSLFRK
jgi:Ca-activated chloride channel family protein